LFALLVWVCLWWLHRFTKPAMNKDFHVQPARVPAWRKQASAMRISS
jgi:hypothetical protein